MTVRLVQFEEPKAAVEDVARAGEPGPRQNGREHAGAGGLAGLHPLRQRPVQNALTVPGGMAVGDAEGGEHLFWRQTDEFAGGSRGAEYSDRRSAVPAAVERAGERDAARYVEPERDSQQHITPADTPEAVAYRQDSAQHRDARMDRAAGVQRVVEIERMTHAGVQQRRLGRRQADAAQQHPAFLHPAPSGDHREKFVDPRRAAAAEHAAKRIENVAAGGCDGAPGQIRITRAADMLRQCPSGIVGHRFFPGVPVLQ